jgi:hypothetical protein
MSCSWVWRSLRAGEDDDNDVVDDGCCWGSLGCSGGSGFRGGGRTGGQKSRVKGWKARSILSLAHQSINQSINQ